MKRKVAQQWKEVRRQIVGLHWSRGAGCTYNNICLSYLVDEEYNGKYRQRHEYGHAVYDCRLDPKRESLHPNVMGALLDLIDMAAAMAERNDKK